MSAPGYTVLAADVEAVIVEKNSDFLTFLHPVSSRADALTLIDSYRQKYPDANHVCWAYVIGNTRQPVTQAFSDAGEPSGTAGKPMLHVLTERELGNALAVVVRYFGGIKLGAGGLVRAYSSAVSTAVDSATLVSVTPRLDVEVIVDFAREAKIRHITAQHDGEIVSVSYTAKVTILLRLPHADLEQFTQQVTNETVGTALINLQL